MHPHQHRIDHCNQALEAVRAAIPTDLYRDVHDYINRFDEWGLGIEILIDQLSEFNINITGEQYKAIEDAMSSMGLGACDRLEYLRQHGVIA